MSDEEDDRENEQVRVSFRLASECHDKSLEVASDTMAIPSHLGRKGLSTVINHLLDRHSPDEDDSDVDDSNDNEKNSTLTFDFMVGEGNLNRLLRTSVEKEARQNGISLEDAVVVTYFPAQQAPEPKNKEPPLPDWISGLAFAKDNSLTVASYDGSLRWYQVGNAGDTLQPSKVVQNAHEGPVKCVRSFTLRDGSAWTASGSMDHSLALHSWPTGRCHARVQHKAAVASVDERIATGDGNAMIASGDWEGGLFLWDMNESDESTDETSKKKRKKGDKSSDKDETTYGLSPTVSVQAHQTKISGIAWGNHAKRNGFSNSHLVTGSWDHSIKVWDMENQDCLLTLNGSKVVSCMDTSHHTAGIVATGHPDCAIRLWDVRTDQSASSLVSDSVFRPSHRAWISQVQWSVDKPYQVISSSHDGTVKLWDIRAALPLHTVRIASKDDKVLALALGAVNDEAVLFAGGTDCELKQYRLNASETKDMDQDPPQKQ